MLAARMRGSSVWSTDLELALSPSSTYDVLVHQRTAAPWWRVALRPVFFATLFGALVTITATEHVTLALLFHIALSWIIVIAWQAIAAAAVILPARRRLVSRRRAFELFFLGHVPWSLWLLATAALLAVAVEPNVPAVVVLLMWLVPVGWTCVVIAAFCRSVLGQTGRAARKTTLVHQLVIWAGTLAYVWFAVGGWTPILQQVGL